MTILQLKYIITIASSSSIREAATKLFVSQPALSASVRELEEELGFKLFERNNRGISLSPEGSEFLNYAKKAVSQYELLEERYISDSGKRSTFAVAAQHHVFPVHAFTRAIQDVTDSRYTFSINQMKTSEILSSVRDSKCEIGVLSCTPSNEGLLMKLCKDYQLDFTPFLEREPSIYVWKTHPLAGTPEISLDDLQDYPCIIFDQDSNKDYYLSEEALSDYKYDKVIKVNDRASAAEIMARLNGYSIGLELIAKSASMSSSIVRISPLEKETITLGYLTKKGHQLSRIGKRYIEELHKYSE